MAINDTLKKIGLTDKEIKVYLALLKSGRITPTNLSKLTKITRPTVYTIAQSLLSKGIIAEDFAGTTLHLTPLPVENLSQIIDKSRRELSEQESFVHKAIAELGLISAENEYPVPKLRFIAEDKLEDFLYDNFVRWNTAVLNTPDTTWWGFQDHSLVEFYEKWILWTWKTKEYQDPRIKAKLLSNLSPIEQKMEKKLSRSKRDIRFVSGMNFTSSIWVAGDYLVMISTRQHPFYLVEIHDAALAHNMREVFKKLWVLTQGNVEKI